MSQNLVWLQKEKEPHHKSLPLEVTLILVPHHQPLQLNPHLSGEYATESDNRSYYQTIP